MPSLSRKWTVILCCVISFFMGLLFACGLCVFIILPTYGQEKYEFGHNQGRITTKLQLMEKVRKVLGDDYRNADGYEPFFEVKADAVVIVERNGIKTLRVYEPKGSPTSPKP